MGARRSWLLAACALSIARAVTAAGGTGGSSDEPPTTRATTTTVERDVSGARIAPRVSCAAAGGVAIGRALCLRRVAHGGAAGGLVYADQLSHSAAPFDGYSIAVETSTPDTPRHLGRYAYSLNDLYVGRGLHEHGTWAADEVPPVAAVASVVSRPVSVPRLSSGDDGAFGHHTLRWRGEMSTAAAVRRPRSCCARHHKRRRAASGRRPQRVDTHQLAQRRARDQARSGARRAGAKTTRGSPRS